MPLPVLVQHLVRNRLGAYCEQRVPAEERASRRVDLRFEDEAVVVFESRPLSGEWVALDIARFRFNRASGTWQLDAPHFGINPSWRTYSNKPVRELDRLIAMLDADADGVFWA